MCFSAQASFIAAGLLSFIGALTFIKANNKQKMLSLVPIFFGIQQLCEGIVWKTIGQETILHTLGMYGFLFFAFAWWPIWIPLSLYHAEENNRQKKLMLWPIGFGLFFSLYQGICIVMYGATAEIVNCSIQYDFYVPNNLYLAGTLVYLLAVLSPIFLSTMRGSKILGIAIALSLAMSYVWYRATLVSIWCFFAAITSLFILQLLRWNQKKK